MKRRNVESTKYRKQFHFRKCKFTEGIYGSSTFVYLKFLLIWIVIMVADFVLEFRFEFLWPFWLLLRSLYDSYKYQGIIFAIFFASIAFFSDLICYMFLPVQWLFFAASTYVWVQYVWHTEKGICLPTISLWLLFVYIEASFRLKSLKTIDLCRPFAAHCIGYPIVTLGFGLKSYLSYKCRLKKQKKIQKLNDFYHSLIKQALPLEVQLKSLNYEAEISVGSKEQAIEIVQTKIDQKSSKTSLLATALSYYLNSTQSTSSTNTSNPLIAEDLPYIQQKDSVNTKKPFNDNKNFSQKFSSTEFSDFNKPNQTNNNFSNTKQYNSNYNLKQTSKQSVTASTATGDTSQIGSLNLPSFSIQSLALNQTENQSSNVNLNSINVNSNGNLLLLTNGPKSNSHHHRSASSNSSSNFIPNNNSHTNININMTINTTAIATATATATTNGQNENPNTGTSPSNSSNNQKKYKNKENKNMTVSNANGKQMNGKLSNETSNDYNYKQGLINNLEEDLKRLKVEIEQQKKVEQYLRDQINYITKCDRTEKLKQENESLQTKFNDLKSQKDKEREQLEKQLQEERKKRLDLEAQLAKEKKLRETTTSLVQTTKQKPIVSSISSTNLVKIAESDTNQKKLVQLESENKELKDDCLKKQDKINLLESEIKNLSKFKESGDTVDCLRIKLDKMEEKNGSLQESLRAETRFKMDLFSALGEAKRQLEFVSRQLDAKETELGALKAIIIKQSLSQNSLSNCLLSESTQTELISQYLADQLSSLQSHTFNSNQLIGAQNGQSEVNHHRSLSCSSPGLHDLNRMSFSPSSSLNNNGSNSPAFDADNLGLNNFMPKI